MKSNFDGPLDIRYDRRASDVLGGNYFRVLKSFRYYLPASFIGNEWTAYQSNRWVFVPSGMLTDLASIPAIFRGFLDTTGPYMQAAVVHDQLCEYLSITQDGQPKSITRPEADLILRAAMLDLNVPKIQVNLIYDAVAAYTEFFDIRDPSTTAIKRRLESDWNFEGLN
jgi:hypothetical protein